MSESDPRAEEWAEDDEETDEHDAVVGEIPYDVNEADAAEQSIDVGLDDDEYR